MPVRIKLCPTFHQDVGGYDPDKGLLLEDAAGEPVRQTARELSVAIELVTCSIIINHYPSGVDRVIQEGDFVALVRVLGVGEKREAQAAKNPVRGLERTQHPWN